MSLKQFSFNGRSSSEFGLYITGDQTYNGPARDYETIRIPGRSGDLLVSNNRYENIRIPYSAFILRNFKYNTDEIRDWLLSADGYCRLEDDYHPDIYRMAYFKGPLDFDVKFDQFGECDIEFEAMPQRFLVSGEQSTTFSKTGTITNPTAFAAKPLIRVYGGGTLTISGVHINITAGNEYIDIDCDLMDAYEGSNNRNGNITLTDGLFPTLMPGSNRITLGSGITKVVITPRWWRL